MNNSLKDSIEQNFGKATITHALESKWAGTEWTCISYEYNKLKWLDKNSVPKPSEEELQIEVDNLQAEYDAQEYARDRATAYPSIGDQLDMQYHDQLNGTTTWKDAIAKVKADNPKEAE